jgi:hypothetical protein
VGGSLNLRAREVGCALGGRPGGARTPILDTFDDGVASALDLGEERIPIGDDGPEIADACLVNAWIVDLADNVMADGEPRLAALAKRGVDRVLSA